MRGSLFGGKVDNDTLVHSKKSREQKTAEEESIGEYKTASEITAEEEEEKYSIYLQQQQTSCSAAQPQLAPSEGAPF
jgi:hypothetical protein